MAEFSTGRSAGKVQCFHEQFILPLMLTDFLSKKYLFAFLFNWLTVGADHRVGVIFCGAGTSRQQDWTVQAA